MGGSPLVYALILNWKSAPDAIRCAESVERSTYPNLKIAVIDNASPDGSEEALRRGLPAHEIIQTGRNLGYSAGNNVGIRFAAAHGADYVWILNPDVVAEPDSLEKMVQGMEADPSIGICGPRVTQTDGPLVQVFDGSRQDAANGFQIVHNPASADQVSPAVAVEFLMGCSMLVRKKAFVTGGLMNESFFLYYDEIEYCLRLRKAGWKAVVFRNAMNTHHWDYRSKGLSKINFKRSYCFVRSAVILARMEKKFLGRTVVHFLKPNMRALFAGHALTVLRTFAYSAVGAAMGLVAPIKPVPQLGDPQ